MRSRKRLTWFFVCAALVVGVSFFVGRSLIASVFYNRAIIYLERKGDLERAEKNIQSALLFKKSDVYYKALSSIYLSEMGLVLSKSDARPEVVQEQYQQLFTKAQSNAKKATELGENNYQNWLQLGNVYAAAATFNIEGAYDKALESYTKAQIIDRDNLLIKLRIAELELAHGNIQKAGEIVDQIFLVRPDYTDALILKAQVEARLGNMNTALETTKKVVAQNPDSPSFLFQLGFFKYTVKDYEGAIEDLKRTLALNPDYANAMYFLGMSYAELGRKEEAIAQFESLLLLNPSSTAVQNELAKLKAVKKTK